MNNNSKYFKILIFSFFLLPIGKLSANAFVFPLLRASYDFNLGYTISWGVGIMNCPGECTGGGYAMYSYSKKGQEFKKNLFSQTKSGSNLSFGLYAGVGIASFRAGLNRMLFKEESESLWGVEASGQMFLFNWVTGAMYNNQSKKIKPNLGFGLGIF
jgi:hypothetical protein